MALPSPGPAVFPATARHAPITTGPITTAAMPAPRGVRHRPSGADAVLRHVPALHGHRRPDRLCTGVRTIDLLISLLTGIG